MEMMCNMSGIIHQSDNIYNSIQTMITTEESMAKLWIYFLFLILAFKQRKVVLIYLFL
jgi:hypothetical protein